jgi:hypothetical protein
MGRLERFLTALAVAGCAAAAIASETVTYTYDARGRLIRVHSNGAYGANVMTNYALDKADNRTNRTTTGAPK